VNAGENIRDCLRAMVGGSSHLKPRTRAEYANLLSGKTRARRDPDGTNTPALSIAATLGIGR
jgi:hypothetical protein